jgi:Fur family peroxide stress response transcriptional regulator
MKAVENTKACGAFLSERLTTSGLRSTRQREHIYRVLLQRRDHPTADGVFLRAKRSMPDISLATVYNCLDALVKCGLVRLVVLNRGATRYCPNMGEHCHYYCTQCGAVFDVPLPATAPLSVSRPKGFKVDHYELAVHGVCADCAGKRKKQEQRLFA